MPVSTMAIWCSSTALITSSSRMEPPGWMTAVMPAWAAASMPSRNGKKASEAMTHPFSVEPAFRVASFTESTRLICPAPIPTVRSRRANTMALDLTCLQTFQAKANAAYSSSVGSRFEATFSVRTSKIAPRSRSCRISPPTIFLRSSRSGPVRTSVRSSPTASRRRSFLRLNSAKASSSKPGATTTSTNVVVISLAVARSTRALNAMTPPKAERGSASRATT